MEKRAVIAIVLSFLIIVVWMQLFPSVEPDPAETAVQSEVATDAPDEVADDRARRAEDTEDLPDTLASTDPPEETEPVEATTVEEVRYENQLFEVVLTNRGGRVLSWKLLGYKSRVAKYLELIATYDEKEFLPLGVDLADSGLARLLNESLFEVDREVVEARDGRAGERITFTWADGRGLEMTKAFTFRESDWLVDVDLRVIDRGRPLEAALTLGPGFASGDASSGSTNYYYSGQVAIDVGGNVERIKPRKLKKGPGEIRGDVRWAGMEEQYFAGIVLPNAGPARASWRPIELTPIRTPGMDPGEEPEPEKQTLLAVSVPQEGAQVFFGPKDYRLLRGLDAELEKSVWFASHPALAWITRQIFMALVWIHDHIVANWGLAIILATFFLRVLLFPVNQYSMVSMKKTQLQMQRLQPKIKAIKAKYKKSKDAASRQKMNEETMAMYRKEGVNPAGGLAGCLPMLAQFPILIGFYNMLTVAVELRGAPFFGWIQDLSVMDPFYITPVAMAGTMFLQQKLAMTKVKDPMQQQQQKMMMFMPLVFGFICLQMPAGMVLYWFVNNVLGIGQQWLVNRTTGRLEAAAQKA